MFQVFVDSAANIPADIVKKYGIQVISFVNFVDGKELINFDPELDEEQERAKGKEYYEGMRNGATIKTSLINTEEFVSRFEPVLKAGEDIMYFSLSKNISGTYNAAKLASEELLEDRDGAYDGRKILLVDSLNASLAQGILAIYAVMMREQGLEMEEIARILQSTAYQMNGVFTVGNLQFLFRTGRADVKDIAVAKLANLGNKLNFKPILRGSKDGFIVLQNGLLRGRKKSLEELVRLVCDNIVEPEKQIIGIAHADAYEDSLYVMEEIQKRVKVGGFINTSYDYCTGSHVGPDCVAMFFIAAGRELNGRPADSAYQMPEVFKYINAGK